MQVLGHYDIYAKSIRQKFVHAQFQSKVSRSTQVEPTITGKIYRAMKFLPTRKQKTATQQFSGVGVVEHYIELTKNNLNDLLPIITMTFNNNMSSSDESTLQKFKQLRDQVTIKPADKNLGLVLMNTDDYITQCTSQLADTNTYRLANHYPREDVTKQLRNALISFKPQIHQYSKRLFEFLLSEPEHCRIPQFHGIPKIHKKFSQVPPIRPIVSQCSSPLSPTAKFIDHVLQPIAQSYPDYLHNSTSLQLILQNLHVPDDAILVTMDVNSLYPSIPQTDMLQIVYDEMTHKRHLLLFDPNLVIQLLHINVNNNYFEFASLIFQQIKGTAMGAAFSPTVANIYMSTTIRRFLRTQHKKPLLLVRYIDDIFIIWTHTERELKNFIEDLNSYNPSLSYTYQYSPSTVDFLDLTIYKSPMFTFTNILDVKTFQKQHNLYQYLHYRSSHQRSVYKGIISGELVRYVRTNTLEINFEAMKTLFVSRLLARDYPRRFIEKIAATVSYKDRAQLLKQAQPTPPKCYPPLYKCPPPPQYKLLKQIVLKNFHLLQTRLSAPRFIPLRYPTLGNTLVRTRLSPSDEQLVDIYTSLSNHSTSCHTIAGQLPLLRTQGARTKRCNHPRCLTCRHLNCSKYVTSSKTGVTYTIRHSFSCTSSNLIYLITCTKCKKQYVGLTTKQLNVRINHHRTSVLNHKQIYLSVHFNFSDHNINNLSVQAIDKVPDQCPQPQQELVRLEKFWINTLKTWQPLGLNVSLGANTQ